MVAPPGSNKQNLNFLVLGFPVGNANVDVQTGIDTANRVVGPALWSSQAKDVYEAPS